MLILLHLRKVQRGQQSAALKKDTHIGMAWITSQPPEGMGQTSWEKSDSLLHCYKVPPAFLPALTPMDLCATGLVSPSPAQSISTTHWASRSLFPPACCLFSSVQFSLSVVSDSLRPHELQHARPLSITNSWSSLKLTSIELVMPSSHLILCRPLLLLPPIPPSIRVFFQ